MKEKKQLNKSIQAFGIIGNTNLLAYIFVFPVFGQTSIADFEIPCECGLW